MNRLIGYILAASGTLISVPVHSAPLPFVPYILVEQTRLLKPLLIEDNSLYDQDPADNIIRFDDSTYCSSSGQCSEEGTDTSEISAHITSGGGILQLSAGGGRGRFLASLVAPREVQMPVGITSLEAAFYVQPWGAGDLSAHAILFENRVFSESLDLALLSGNEITSFRSDRIYILPTDFDQNNEPALRLTLQFDLGQGASSSFLSATLSSSQFVVPLPGALPLLLTALALLSLRGSPRARTT